MTPQDIERNVERKKPVVAFALDQQYIADLDALAKADHRTRSQYLRVIVIEKLQSIKTEGCKL